MNRRKWTQPLLLAMLLLAFALRLYRLDYQELRGDEVFGYFFSLRPLTEIIPATLALREPHPVASYYLQHLWLNCVGGNLSDHGEFVVRFPSVWFGLLAVALLYALARQLFSPSTALLATLLLACSPYAIWHSQDARMYSMSLALTTASTWLMIRWQTQRRWGVAVGYLVATLLALNIHYFTLFVVAAQNLYQVGRALIRRQLRPDFAQWLLLQGIVALCYLPWLLHVRGILGNYGGNGDSPALAAMLWRALGVFAVGESTPAAERIVWAWLVGILLLWAVIVLWRRGREDRQALLLLGLSLAVPLLATWWSARTRPIFNERYLVAALPGFYILLATLGSAPVEWRYRRMAGTVFRLLPPLLLFSLLAVGYVPALLRHYDDPSYSKTRGWRELAQIAAQWSAGLPTAKARIAQNFPDPTLWYYYNGLVDHIVLPPQPHDQTGAAATVTQLVAADVQRVILPRQPAPNWDSAQLADGALQGAYYPILERTVGGWSVALYSRMPTPLIAHTVPFTNGLALTGFGLSQEALTPGGVIVVGLSWSETNVKLTGGEKVFVQLLNGAGQLVAQDDRPLSRQGCAGDAACLSAQIACSNAIDCLSIYGILLPASLPPGSYRLITGLYDPTVTGAPRLLTVAGQDHVELTIFTVKGM